MEDGDGGEIGPPRIFDKFTPMSIESFGVSRELAQDRKF